MEPNIVSFTPLVNAAIGGTIGLFFSEYFSKKDYTAVAHIAFGIWVYLALLYLCDRIILPMLS